MHELVIFDCDGVLVDSEVISNEVLARMLTREGLPTTLSEARGACQGLLLTDIRDQAEAKLGRPLPPGWLAEYERERAEEFRRSLKAVPGAAEAVTAGQGRRIEGLRRFARRIGKDTTDARADRPSRTIPRWRAVLGL
jgi:beta-phosphoglucomutase-like phosphatase (HAD superfamily)